MNSQPPAPHQLEISVFGPGVGESVVVHLGDGDWVVVDSCIDRRTGQPVALDYLRSLGINVESQVKLVVATHWHDDHIHGLAEILKVAEKAKFVNSAAYTLQQLTRLTKLSEKAAPRSSATREFNRIIELLTQRRQRGEKSSAVGPIPALANKNLLTLSTPQRSLKAEVHALSPADGVFNRAAAELEAAILAIENSRRPSLLGPNQLCVALWLRVGVLNVILGADLEHVAGTTEGWNAIVSSDERPRGRAGFFKVPHHGSRNADCPECWTDLLSEKPVAIVTAYSPGGLPKSRDLKRLCERASSVFSTGDSARYGLPRRDNAVEKTLRETTVARRALSGQMGHVQLRSDARDLPEDGTSVHFENGAQSRCA